MFTPYRRTAALPCLLVLLHTADLAAQLAERTFSGRSGMRTPNQFFTVGSVMMRAWMRPFRADYEREADLDGARWSYQAGYDCRELAELFLRHHQHQGNANLPIPEFFCSHPAGPDRHAAVMDEYQRLQAENPRNDLVAGEQNLRDRAAVGQKP